MITRSHIKDDAPSTAVYSDCERYRYSLTRIWARSGPRALFVMLNPSTATERVFYAPKSVFITQYHIDRNRTLC